MVTDDWVHGEVREHLNRCPGVYPADIQENIHRMTGVWLPLCRVQDALKTLQREGLATYARCKADGGPGWIPCAPKGGEVGDG